MEKKKTSINNIAVISNYREYRRFINHFRLDIKKYRLISSVSDVMGIDFDDYIILNYKYATHEIMGALLPRIRGNKL